MRAGPARRFPQHYRTGPQVLRMLAAKASWRWTSIRKRAWSIVVEMPGVRAAVPTFPNPILQDEVGCVKPHQHKLHASGPELQRICAAVG